jgi:hypothetical protein
VSIHNTYRLVYTSPGGRQSASSPLTRETAMAYFDQQMGAGAKPPWIGRERLRVITEKTWLETQAATR